MILKGKDNLNTDCKFFFSVMVCAESDVDLVIYLYDVQFQQVYFEGYEKTSQTMRSILEKRIFI